MCLRALLVFPSPRPTGRPHQPGEVQAGIILRGGAPHQEGGVVGGALRTLKDVRGGFEFLKLFDF